MDNNGALHIQLFGGCHLSRNDAPITDVDTARLQSFLGYLLIYAQKPQPRQQIAAALWTESSEAQARTNLRKCLHRLRHVLPEIDQFLLVDGNTLHWRSTDAVIVDIHEFERVCVAAFKHKAAGQAQEVIVTLKQAIALYQGALLPVCYDDWIASPRDRFANQYMLALQELISNLENQQQYTEALFYAHQWLEHNPLDEAAYQRLISLYIHVENPAKALELYKQCVVMLKQEFNLAPSPATITLVEHLKTAPDALATYTANGTAALSILFTDVAGFNKLAEAYASHRLVERLNAYMNLLNQLIEAEHGQIIKRVSDSVLAVFAQPSAALQAAYAIQSALRDFNGRDAHLPFYTRIGITTGQVSIIRLNIEGKHEYEVMGNPVNLVTRLQQASPLNGVALDAATYAACEATLATKAKPSIQPLTHLTTPVYLIEPAAID